MIEVPVLKLLQASLEFFTERDDLFRIGLSLNQTIQFLKSFVGCEIHGSALGMGGRIAPANLTQNIDRRRIFQCAKLRHEAEKKG